MPDADGARRLFVYGTLVDDHRVTAVAGRTFPRRAGMLHGFVRHAPPGGYPYVVPAAGGTVAGFVLDDLDAAALAAFDAYEDEGRLYDRRTVAVSVDGTSVECDVYVGTGIVAAAR